MGCVLFIDPEPQTKVLRWLRRRAGYERSQAYDVASVTPKRQCYPL